MPISLNTVVISNFKSFFDETVIGPIEPFTAIIGPNGCGKSNIVDAISFALGEKPRALRVNCLNELVYYDPIGESRMERVTYVKVIFKVDDNKEISFTRTIHGETSQYKIDNQIVTNIFYMATLREMGLDIKAGNFLIPQGYIENFALDMLKNMTAMFEQTSNSIEYKADYERLKLEHSKALEEVHFEYKMKRQILNQKKHANVEKTETERYLQLNEQYNKKKLKFQLIQLLLIKKRIEFLQNKEKEMKLQTDKHLDDKMTAIMLMERTKSKFNLLFAPLENVEQDILKMENIIQQKKTEHNVFEEDISHWQKERDCARVSLNSANKARDTKQRNIQELTDELKRIDNILTELRKASQTSTIELSNSQVKRYMELTNEVERRTEDYIKQINSLMHKQQEDHYKLDNENRRKQELEDKVKQIKLTKESREARLKKLQDLIVKSEATLPEKTAKIKKLNKKILETRNKLLSLENDIAKITEELSDIDDNTVSRWTKKHETINKLKQINSGVYGRLSDLCKPIHSRYNVAITKVFGKNMDAIVVDTEDTATQCIQYLKQRKIGIETFLPLESIKKRVLKEQLRAIKEPKNVKLLYDVLDISTAEINTAVLFVTKNTLVCETIEDAMTIAYNEDKLKAYDCVTLDGCLFRKKGPMSGGQTDLIVKAKQWNEQQVVTLKEQKAQLMQELRNLPNISFMQSELELFNVEVKGFANQNKYIGIDMEEIKNEIVMMNKELDELRDRLIVSNTIITEIQGNMQERSEKVTSVERNVNAIKNNIFVDFCNDINVPDISYYEKNNLRFYQEQKTRQMDLEQQHDRIENQLRLENENDTESKVLKWEQAVKRADAELTKAYQQDRNAKSEIELEETKMLTLKDRYTNVKKDLENLEGELSERRLQINFFEKLYLESRKAHIALQKKIETKIIECNTILKECKMEDIVVPMLETSRRSGGNNFTSSSSSNAESLEDCKVLTKINFSQFPKDILNSTEEELQNMAKQLDEKLTKIQDEFNEVKPNLKVHEKIDSIAQEIQKINTNFQNCRKKCNEIQTQFELVKAKRYKLFSDCLEHVAAEIDSIYKNLVNDTSAQAFILSDNLEEPYLGNIIYNCIAPSKGFLPLQCLSGGETSLAGLALLFAIQRYKKIPFLILDEGDAALDKANIKNVVRFIKSQENTTQCIMISLHKELYCYAKGLIGVTAKRDRYPIMSKVFSISLKKYREVQ
ncbi:PREDICTED: structural maintenance of chromosomes protein 1A-like [Wasmannia auropunctata]|uniref:structural maintenance of chromosomes protein 1A-like n=1 Tax=Wasmannia auropunctata TaxID=64793 RepID=UPI0005EEBA8C|nr:PREDICTED: structural maintenance of chromosomes protein 1A-like [Wasmannia auropunctata]